MISEAKKSVGSEEMMSAGRSRIRAFTRRLIFQFHYFFKGHPPTSATSLKGVLMANILF